MINYIIVGVSLFLFSGHCLADYRHFLWVPSKHAAITVPDVILNDGSQIVRGDAVGGLNGSHNAVVVMSRCLGTNDNLQGTQTKNSWLILPEQVKFNGATIKIAVLANNGWNTAQGRPSQGWVAKVNQTKVNGPISGCWKTGLNGSAFFTWKDAVIQITLPKQALPPGTYSVPVEYHYAFEENKFVGTGSNAGDIAQLIQSTPGTKSIFYINMTVSSHCKNDSTQKLELSHGTILTNDLQEHKSPAYNIKMECTPGTSVSFKLSGTKPVAGKNQNFTTCGAGACELNFDGDKYDETYKVNESGILNLPVTSTFHFDRDNIVEGPFSGSGFLSIQVN